MSHAIYPLFSYPLMICGENYQFSNDEKEFIAELDMVDNTGNLMSKDDKVLDSDALADLRRFIDTQVYNFKKNLLSIPDENEIYITQSWVNKAHPDAFHPKHRHQNSVISGVMYVDENDDGSLPPIRFHRTLDLFSVDFRFDELNEFNASAREFDTSQGMLMLFPSLLEHDVAKNMSDRMRTSISFNTFVRGKIGGSKQLTEVDLS